MRYFTVTYWDREMRNKQEKQFPSQADAIRFIMILDPHFRTQIEDHDDALGG